MNEVKSLDERLRKRASRKLTQDLDAAMAGLETWGRNVLYTKIPSLKKGETHIAVNVGMALDEIRKAMIERELPHYEQKEIDAFLSRPDAIQEELDELRDIFEDGTEGI